MSTNTKTRDAKNGESVAIATESLRSKVQSVLNANPAFWGSVKLDILIQDGLVTNVQETTTNSKKIVFDQ